MQLSLSPVRQAKKAFTLIELLVVIAIIAILAAILFPVFGRARENARKISCLSNMKQIGLGIFQYAQDYDEKYPPRENGVSGWRVLTQPYLKSTQLFSCPSNPYNSEPGAQAGEEALGIKKSYNAPQLRTNLGALADGIPSDSLWRQNDGVAMASVESSAQVLMVGEAAGTGAVGGFSDLPINNPDWGNNPNAVFAGHLSFANWCFADGHAKSLKPLRTMNDQDNGGSVNMWTVDNKPFSGAAFTQIRNNLAASEKKYQ
ncbi:hypothetical protein B1R32_1238 [Abditibacterium utsteinense]|uniref:DUF1559 domain-containing protein n=1 Tax=Abditibacterium utsteinense TaxID=1960156 RepID=A0A2S8SPL9_9BACT|nr:DUF1559 domain-containing protein [Abditibacterium utsteinense]PQV62724.1 hypothetical protein B1R32_1238 [Abditibacterium utsteinense]